MANEKRLIGANRVIDALLLQFPQINVPFVQMALESIPTVDAVEVVHGRWVELPTPRTMWKYRCDKCGCPQDYAHNYCPHCGAKMDGGNEDSYEEKNT